MKILVTGGSGFIGSSLIRLLLEQPDNRVINVDRLTYAAHPEALASVARDPRYTFSRTDICDQLSMERLLQAHRPDAIIHLAAESHVDRSIQGPAEFIQTNLVGTFVLLEAVRDYYRSRSAAQQRQFRFLHVSTDEVYGDIPPEQGAAREGQAYHPGSPYAASKAGADHLVAAWHRTYGIPALISHCSNNYGPWQFPEKLIPLVITRALAGEPLPVYGDGLQVRDWLHVSDHARALQTLLHHGRPGEHYNISGQTTCRNIDLVYQLCDLLTALAPARAPAAGYRSLVRFVPDRPGHDERYAINAAKIERELGWKPAIPFQQGLRDTVSWYLNHA